MNYFLPQHLHFIHLNNVKKYVPNCLLFGYFRLCHSILQFSSDNFIAISFIINLNLELFELFGFEILHPGSYFLCKFSFTGQNC